MGSPKRHFLRMCVNRFTCLLAGAEGNTAGDSASLIQGSCFYLIILTGHLNGVPVTFLLQALSNIVFAETNSFNKVTYFAEIFSSEMFWQVQMLAQ